MSGTRSQREHRPNYRDHGIQEARNKDHDEQEKVYSMRGSLLDISPQPIFGPTSNGTEQLLPGMHQPPNRSGERKEAGCSAVLVWVRLLLVSPSGNAVEWEFRAQFGDWVCLNVFPALLQGQIV